MKDKILFVVTSHGELGDSGKPTGYWLAEVTHPWSVLCDKFDIGVVSPKGGRPPVDGFDLSDPINRRLWDDVEWQNKMSATMTPVDVIPGDYKAIFYAGGHGAMWDFPDNERLAQIAAEIYENGGYVAAVCHGPAGLLNIKLTDGSYLVKGKQLAPGTYTLTVINTAGKTEITPENQRVTVTMEEKPVNTVIEVSDFTVNKGGEVIRNVPAEFRFKLSCTEGFVDEDVHVYIFKNGYGYDVMSHTFQAPLISAGESVEESAKIDLSSLEVGRYQAYVYYGHSFEGQPATFEIKPDIVTSVEVLEDDNTPAGPVYDLNGRLLREIPVGVHVIIGHKLVIVRR